MEVRRNQSYGNGLYDLYLPDTMPAPLYMQIHGGSLEAGDKTDFEAAARTLAERGIAVAAIDYRMYPTAKFPDYIEDAADAYACLLGRAKELGGFCATYIGGNSAGAYIASMLFFDKRYLRARGLDPNAVNGYFLDAGQPTTHFNVLRERGVDQRAIRVDEAAPIYFVDRMVEEPLSLPRLLFLAADNDMPCRLEQHYLLLRTLYAFGYSPARVTFRLMHGYKHCGYCDQPVYTDVLTEFMQPSLHVQA